MATMDDLAKKFATRLWIAFLIGVLVVILFRAMSWCEGKDALSTLSWIFGLYMAGDVADGVKAHLTTTPVVEPPK